MSTADAEERLWAAIAHQSDRDHTLVNVGDLRDALGALLWHQGMHNKLRALVEEPSFLPYSAPRETIEEAVQSLIGDPPLCRCQAFGMEHTFDPLLCEEEI